MLLKFINNQYQKIQHLIDNKKNTQIEENRKLFYSKFLPQSESEFINMCFKNNSYECKKTALAIRNSIAKVGQVDNNYIRSDLSFSDLDLLPIWDFDSFKTTLLIIVIESELGIHFTDKQLESASVRNPDLNPDMKIHEFINQFYYWYNSLNLT